MLTIWGNDHSSCVQKVMWAIGELELPHRRIDLGGAFGGLGEPDYVKLNPNRVIPTMDEDGFVLWESAAILQYLCAKHGAGTLYPDDLRARGEAYRWIAWQGGTVRPAIMSLYVQWMVWKPEFRHLDELEGLRRRMLDTWAIVENALADRPYLCGDTFCMGDIPLGIMAHWWFGFPIPHGDLPHLRRWYDRVAARPAFQRHVATPSGH